MRSVVLRHHPQCGHRRHRPAQPAKCGEHAERIAVEHRPQAKKAHSRNGVDDVAGPVDPQCSRDLERRTTASLPESDPERAEKSRLDSEGTGDDAAQQCQSVILRQVHGQALAEEQRGRSTRMPASQDRSVTDAEHSKFIRPGTPFPRCDDVRVVDVVSPHTLTGSPDKHEHPVRTPRAGRGSVMHRQEVSGPVIEVQGLERRLTGAARFDLVVSHA